MFFFEQGAPPAPQAQVEKSIVVDIAPAPEDASASAADVVKLLTLLSQTSGTHSLEGTL